MFTILNCIRYHDLMVEQRTKRVSRSVGFIGLGVMGRPMARHILTKLPAGGTLHVSSRRAASATDLVTAGAQWHDDPAGVVAAADVIVIMVPALDDVRAVIEGTGGLLEGVTRPTVAAISSTISPQAAKEVARSAYERSGGMLRIVDAPVSGGEEGAVAGTLSIMVGGSEADVAATLPVLHLMGTPVHLGPVGAGQVAKACNQMIVAATVTALAEAAVLAERSGIDVAAMYDLLGTGYAASRIMEVKKRRFAEHDHSPSGPARFMIKDLGAAQESARAEGVVTPQTDLLLQLFTDLTARGMGDADTAVMQAYLESLAAELQR